MAVYEVVLRFSDREEVRVTDRALEVGDVLEIDGNGWLVESEEPQAGQDAARYICVELRERSRELRASSSKLIGLEEWRERGPADGS